MSYYGDDDADVDSPMFTRKAWVGIVVPLCVVAGIVLIALIFFYHRWHVRRNRTGILLDQQGRLALERDMQQRYSRGSGGGSRRVPSEYSNQFFIGPDGKTIYNRRRDPYVHLAVEGNDEEYNLAVQLNYNNHEPAPPVPRRYWLGPRIANRWAWAYTTSLVPAPGNSHAEGLDFYPPPPYEPRRNLSRSNSGDSIEMPGSDGREAEDGATAQEGVTVPAPAHVRHSSGSGSGSGLGSNPRPADPSPRYCPPVFSSLEETYEASLAAGSSLAPPSSTPSTAAASPP